MDLEKIKNKKVVVKSKYTEMRGYEKWTEVSIFLSCGLVGVNRKYKIMLRDL
jgi:hypothetical protein|tara:strand:+ start:69 stop:224 length:156 start_codon:yes stop_codon:yes gene_type:complete